MSDVTDLKAEVLLLRRENAELRDEIKHLLIKRQHTEDVNAKLREQVDYMTPLALYAASERERDRMRELGVEVE